MYEPLTSPLPFNFPDRALDYLPSGPGFSAPFPTQEVQEAPFTQYIPDLPSGYQEYNIGPQDHMAREVSGCFSPHPGGIQIPQSGNPVEMATPIYQPDERRWNSSSCKRVLFSPVYG